MTNQQLKDLRELEGRQVSLALVDGSRIDDATLVSAGRGHTNTIWLFDAGNDVFIAIADVRQGWESHPSRVAA
ncbi:MAG: hypothetical protein ACRD2W_01485 [Acidimicrobiales bacterium]